MKSLTKLSLVLLTAVAFAALPAIAQDSTSTNTPTQTPRPRAAQFRGTVSTVDTAAMTITLKGRAGDTTVKVTSDTKITKDREPAVFADVKEGLRAAGSGVKQDDGSWIAHTLRLTTAAPRRAPSTNAPPSATPQQ